MTSSRVLFIAFVFGVWTLQYSVSVAAPETFCRDYAQQAARQYDEALARGAPNIDPPVWSNNQDGHFSWCRLFDEALVSAETNKREQVLAQYRGGQLPPPAQIAPPPTARPPSGNTGTIIGPYTKIDDSCARYAKEAVSHQQLNEQKACGFKGPRWSDEQANHENWCRQQTSIDRAMAEHKARVDRLVACQQTASIAPPSGAAPGPSNDPRDLEPLLVPGLVLAMWHGACGYDSPPTGNMNSGNMNSRLSLSTLAKADWMRFKQRLDQPAGLFDLAGRALYSAECAYDVGSPGDASFGPDAQPGLSWIQLADLPVQIDIQKLPPGLLLAFRPKNWQRLRRAADSPAFGELPRFYEQTVAPGPTPGLKNYCARDVKNFDGEPIQCDYAWFETDNEMSDVDWSLVERLPRYTIVGLKYHSNDKGDWLGNQYWKKLRWIGPNGNGMKLYDPGCRDCQPPPGFIRVEAGDWGASAGQGFVWFMKVTGPDISK